MLAPNQLETLFKIILPSSTFFAIFCVAGIWFDLLIAKRLVNRTARIFLLPVSGATSLAFFVTNASYYGLRTGIGIWVALPFFALVSAFLLFKKADEFWKKPSRLWPLLPICFVGVGALCLPLISAGWLTTIGKDNGDWYTYVTHADYWSRYPFFHIADSLRFPQLVNPVLLYQNHFLRVGPSQLFAAYSTFSGARGIYSYNVFCGLLLSVAVSGFGFVLTRLLRTKPVSTLCLALAWGLHPLVLFASFGAFMPQLLGQALLFVGIGVITLLPAKRPRLEQWVFFWFVVCGLIVCYGELLPIYLATVAFSFLVLYKPIILHWRKIAQFAAIGFLIIAVLQPIAIWRGVKGIIIQAELARSSGGGQQAIERPAFFAASVLGYSKLPPSEESYQAEQASPAYWLTNIELLGVLGFYGLALARSRVLRSAPLIAFTAAAVAIAVYILVTFDIPRFRSWGIFKLAQYFLPILMITLYSGVLSLKSKTQKLALAACASCLLISPFLNSAKIVGSLSKIAANPSAPRPGQVMARVDEEFVRKADELLPSDQRVLSLNQASEIDKTFPTLYLLLFPRAVVPSNFAGAEADPRNYSLAVVDKSGAYNTFDVGSKIWENERFIIAKLDKTRLQLSGAGPYPNMLSPGTKFTAPACSPGSSVLLHLYSIDRQTIRIRDAVSGKVSVEQPVFQEAQVTAPLTPAPDGKCEAELNSDYPVGVFSAKLVSYTTSLQTMGARMQSSGVGGSTLPPLSEKNWHVTLFDGAKIAPSARFGLDELTLSAAAPTSAALNATVSVSQGWYIVRAQMDVNEKVEGNGKGLGIGFLGRSDTYFGRMPGRYAIENAAYFEAPQKVGFGAIIGGFGLAKGSATFSDVVVEKAPSAGKTAPVAAVELPPYNSPAWGSVVFDNVKSAPTSSVTPEGFDLSSDSLTSGGRIAQVRLAKGTYLIEGDIAATRTSEGSGLGYAFGIVGIPNGMSSTKASGFLHTSKLISVPSDGVYGFAAIIGGFGTSKGAASIRNLRLYYLPGLVPPVSAPKSESVLLDGSIDPAKWRLAPLDGSAAKPEISFSKSSIAIRSNKPASAALVNEMKFADGWYAFSADIVVEQEAQGTGRGFGLSLLNPNELNWYAAKRGQHSARQIIRLNAKNRPFSLVFGGFGLITGSATFRNIRIERLNPKLLD